MLSMKIYPSKYYFSEKAKRFVLQKFKEILDSGSFLTDGKYCREFEEKFAKYIGVKYALAVNSGTSALEAIFNSLDLKNREVIVTTNTFAATVYAIIRSGAVPVFADILPDMTIDPDDVRKRITKNTAAVVTVHIGGLVSPAIEKLVKLCKEKNILLIEDAAHAYGSAYKDKRAGTFGIAGAFSFFATKVITTGEGGMVVTNKKEIAEKIKIMRDQGKIEGKNYHRQMGWNWRMTEIEALMGLAQIKEFNKIIKKRQDIASFYDRELKGVKNIKILFFSKEVRHNFYKYFVFLDNSLNPAEIIKTMKEKYSIPLQMGTYEIPCHQQPIFKEYNRGSLPMAEKLCTTHICLPIYYELTLKQAKYITSCFKKEIKNK